MADSYDGALELHEHSVSSVESMLDASTARRVGGPFT